jgi:hypothetical protein
MLRKEGAPKQRQGRGNGTTLLLACLAALLSSCGPEIDFPHAPFEPTTPEVVSIRYAAFVRGQTDSLRVMAIDADGDPVHSIEADLSGLPPGNDATFSILPPSSGTNVLEGRLTWTPAPGDTGRYPVSFTAINDRRGASATTLIYTIDHVDDQFPIVTCPDSLHLEVGVEQVVSVSAEDPDGDPLFQFVPTDPLYTGKQLPVSLLSWNAVISGSRATGSLRLRANRAGIYSVSFTAINAGHGFGTMTLVAREP